MSSPEVIQIGDLSNVTVVELNSVGVSVAEITGPVAGVGSGGGEVNPVVDWFTGTGPPPSNLIGAGLGDMYVDLSTGQLYQLR